ncbi:unnamed protein product [Cylicocyclus nassatus]|uniref:Uncharacterized protein n=1 Tax=Cylicocyclus nassatus TaxID=53992 RepID=A0AA36H8X0_CYLNA|nr:unnamed protein product [Cylicocyclus nassatus]
MMLRETFGLYLSFTGYGVELELLIVFAETGATSLQQYLPVLESYILDVVLYICVTFVLKYAKPVSDKRTFRRPDLSQVLSPVDSCHQGIIESDGDKPPKRTVRTFKNADALCQMMAFYEPLFQKNECIEWAIQDVVVRTSYVKSSSLNDTTPFCIFGVKAVLCYCAGNSCFRHSWSIVEFLLQLYRNNEKKSLREFRAPFDTYNIDHMAQRKNFWCFLKAFRYRFYDIEIPDMIPHYRSSTLEEDWTKFYEEITRRFPEKTDDKKKGDVDGDKKKDGDEKKDEGGRKRKNRLFAVAAFMGGFNALTICAIVTFFIWYKSYVKKEKLKQATLQAAEEQASEPSSTTPGAPSPVAASPAPAAAPAPAPGAVPVAAPQPVVQQAVQGFPGVDPGVAPGAVPVAPAEAPAPAAPEQFVPEGIVPDPAPPPDSLVVKF